MQGPIIEVAGNYLGCNYPRGMIKSHMKTSFLPTDSKLCFKSCKTNQILLSDPGCETKNLSWSLWQTKSSSHTPYALSVVLGESLLVLLWWPILNASDAHCILWLFQSYQMTAPLYLQHWQKSHRTMGLNTLKSSSVQNWVMFSCGPVLPLAMWNEGKRSTCSVAGGPPLS